jgi:cytoskeletal protein CcmA (bactofilin family)
VEDVVISQLTPVKRVQTCGRVVVRRKGSVIAELVQAHGGVEVLGCLDARVESDGPVIIGPAARWKGDCHAPSLVIEPGARIEAGRFAVQGSDHGSRAATHLV